MEEIPIDTTTGSLNSTSLTGIIVLLPLELFFGYVISRGLIIASKTLMTSGKKGIFVLGLLVAFTLLCITNGSLEGFFQKSQKKLSWSKDGAETGVNIWIPGRTSHSLCSLIGFVAANWVRNTAFLSVKDLAVHLQKSIATILFSILHFLFALGCFLWWWLWLPQLVSNPLTRNMNFIEGVLLSLTHTLSFSVGIFFHQDYYRRQLDKLGDDTVNNYYLKAGLSLIAVPLLWQAVTEQLGFSHFLFVVQVPLLLWMLSTGIPRQDKTNSYMTWIVCVAFTISLFLSSSSVVEPLNKNIPSEWLSAELLPKIPLEMFSKDFLMGLGVGVLTLVIVFGKKFVDWFTTPKQTVYETISSVKAMSLRSREERGAFFPPPYPNGWFRIMDSDLLKPGELKFVSCLGKDFVVFRESTGKARVLDAYCPHLGANLGLGKVVNDNVECPFHQWQWRGDGACATIPYKEGPPPASAKIKSYEVDEVAGMVMVWHHTEGKPSSWKLYHVPEVESGKLRFCGRSEYNAEMHVQDIAENAADPAHFSVLHTTINMPIPFIAPFFFISHEIVWRGGVSNASLHINRDVPFWESDTPHLSSFVDFAELNTVFSDKPIMPGNTYCIVTFVGPGIIYFRFVTPYGVVLLVKSMLPTGILLVQATDNWWAEKSVPSFLMNYIRSQAEKGFLDDIYVWANKTYSHRPMVIQEDGPVKKLRKWYRQFYTDSKELGFEETEKSKGSGDSGEVDFERREEKGPGKLRGPKEFTPLCVLNEW